MRVSCDLRLSPAQDVAVRYGVVWCGVVGGRVLGLFLFSLVLASDPQRPSMRNNLDRAANIQCYAASLDQTDQTQARRWLAGWLQKKKNTAPYVASQRMISIESVAPPRSLRMGMVRPCRMVF